MRHLPDRVKTIGEIWRRHVSLLREVASKSAPEEAERIKAFVRKYADTNFALEASAQEIERDLAASRRALIKAKIVATIATATRSQTAAGRAEKYIADVTRFISSMKAKQKDFEADLRVLDITLNSEFAAICGDPPSLLLYRNSSAAPPEFAEYVLQLILSKTDRENVIGDLAEEYVEISLKYGARKANFWYYK